MGMKRICTGLMQYKYLLYQLVARDFKVKYKRSVLGILWSVLHPLFMMLIMSLVFQKLFRMTSSGSTNYPVYIITGLVVFNFLTEATNNALISITGNFSLITKVHIPKSIFPLSKVLSSCVNLFFSMIALYAVIITTGEAITWQHIWLLYDFICLFLFTLGLGFVLSALTVFFRDMIYLYSLLIMVWTYLTPIFYDLSIVEETLLPVFTANPMYQYITFARTVILYHATPAKGQFVVVFLYGVLLLWLGYMFFRRMQKKFIYYI